MAIGIGLIGCGVMGSDHAEILCRDVPGGALVAAHDADIARARRLGRHCGDVAVIETAASLIEDPSVDAVLIASPDDTHAELVLACLAAGKPVLCEKPLAATVAECRAIVAAECAIGRILVQVGFMRRFDPGYRAMRAARLGPDFGAALLLHCVHRNKVAPDYVTAELVIANSTLHEFDIARYLLDEEFITVRVDRARASRHSANRQALLVTLRTMSGVLVSVEMSPDVQYGYDVRAELVCEDGTIRLAPSPPIAIRQAGLSGHAVDEDWRPRFAEAYRVQLRDWVAAIATDTRPVGASAWDGFMAAVTSEAALASLASGETVGVPPAECPNLYQYP